MDSNPSFFKRHAVVIFFVLAYLLSWMWVPIAALLGGPFLFPLGPLVAALIMVTVTGSWRDFLSRVLRWRVPIRWYAVAILVPITMSLAAVSINVTLGAPMPTTAVVGPLTGLPLIFLNAIPDAPLFEEPGWRGFALPRFPANRSRLANTALLGLLLVGWHAPLILFEPALAPAYLIGTFASAFVTNWVYYNTHESALLALLYHSVANTFGIFFGPAFSGADMVRQAWLLTAANIVVALLILAATNVTFFSRRAQARMEPVPAAAGD
jgi:membrane protease YdiL (CAAX protease family)